MKKFQRVRRFSNKTHPVIDNLSELRSSGQFHDVIISASKSDYSQIIENKMKKLTRISLCKKSKEIPNQHKCHKIILSSAGNAFMKNILKSVDQSICQTLIKEQEPEESIVKAPDDHDYTAYDDNFEAFDTTEDYDDADTTFDDLDLNSSPTKAENTKEELLGLLLSFVQFA